MMHCGHSSFEELISLDNLFSCWEQFKLGKTRKNDVIWFSRHLEDKLFLLHEDLATNAYRHGSYTRFMVFDGKKRSIHKAPVRDRIVHQVLHNYLQEIFEPQFIVNSYASRVDKGAHEAMRTLHYFMRLAASNERRVFVLKCDIKRFFENIRHSTLLEILRSHIHDPQTFNLLSEVVLSFETNPGSNGGMPLGNVTSQIFANIYLHELDIFVKRVARARWYVRYNDDFVVIDTSEERLLGFQAAIQRFLAPRLGLQIPTNKTIIRKVSHGVDFLGFRVAPDFVLLRKSTKSKVTERFRAYNASSYLGLLQHANTFRLRGKILSDFFWGQDNIFDIQ